MITTCMKCGQTNPTNAAFCAECGTALRPAVSQPPTVVSDPTHKADATIPSPTLNVNAGLYPYTPPTGSTPNYVNTSPTYNGIVAPPAITPRKSGANLFVIVGGVITLLLLAAVGATLAATRSGPFAPAAATATGVAAPINITPTVDLISLFPTTTPRPTATATPEPTNTVIATATALPTRTPGATSTSKGSSWKTLRGPQQIKLPHQKDKQTYKGFDSRVNISDFYASATFYNPYAATKGGWDYGFEFRANTDGAFAVVVDSSSNWYLYYYKGSSAWTKVQSGTLAEPLKLGFDDPNRLELEVSGTIGSFAVNGKVVSKNLDLTKLSGTGDVQCATGFFLKNYIEGSTTYAEEFKIEVKS